MPYSENISVSSFRPVDYNDLEMTFSSSNHNAIKNQQDFKLSLQSIDDNELDDFRRSLVTPMSLNNIQDPMYKEFEKTRELRKQYLSGVKLSSLQNKRQPILSPTSSYSGSVADSLAVFNRLIDDHNSDDLVQSDLKDYMSPYNMDDLVSLPQSRTPTSPSPQINRGTTTTRYNSPMAPIETKGNHNTTPTNTSTYIKSRKVSIDASVQTPSFFGPNKPSPTQSKERLETKYKKPNLPKVELMKTLQPKQTDKRRWSSYIPEKNEKVTSKLSQLSNRNRLSTIVNRSSQVDEIKNNHSNLTQQNKGRAPLLSDVESSKLISSTNTLQRRTSVRVKEDLKHSMNECNVSNTVRQSIPKRHTHRLSLNDLSTNKNVETDQQHQHDETTSNIYLQRRLSLMNDDKNQQKPIESKRDIISSITSRYSQKRLSRNKLPDVKPNESKPIEQNDRSVYKTRQSLQRDNNLTSSLVASINTSRNYVEQHKHGSSETDNRTSKHATSQNSTLPKSYNLNKRLSSSGLSSIPTSTMPTSAIPIASTSSAQLRRVRSLTVPSSRYCNPDQAPKPSLMPVPTFRHRKSSGHNLSKYASVPEDQVAPQENQVQKGVRFSLIKPRSSNEVQPVASHSSSGQSNTTSSSYSEDMEYNPPTPPGSFIETRFERRKSITLNNPPRLNKYEHYLNRMKDTYEVEVVPKEYRRQRVVSEDNNSYKNQQRCVTESAREVLAQVKERRAKTAAILNHNPYK